MADYTQDTITLLAKQSIEHPDSVMGAAQTVSSYLAGVVYIRKACVETTADLTAGLDYFVIQISPDATGETWVDYHRQTPSGTAAVTKPVTDTEAVGQTVLTCADTTGLTAGMKAFLTDATDELNNSEWVDIIAVVTNTSVEIASGLVYAKANGDDIYSQAENWAIPIDFAGIHRVRAGVVHQGATGSNWYVEITMTAATDLE